MTSSGMASSHRAERGSTGPDGPAGSTVMNGARACSATRCSAESLVPMQARRQPRRAASAAMARVCAVAPGADTAITASAAPTQPGRRSACEAMTWTGLPGPTTAPSTSPARPALPRPVATSARGLASGVKADRFASWQDRSEVRTCAAADATCRSTSPGSAASITSGVSSRSAAKANSDPPQSSRLSLMPYLSWRISHGWSPGRLASSTSSTGMSSRTG